MSDHPTCSQVSYVRVLHMTVEERENYYLNNLAAEIPADKVHLGIVTLGRDRGLGTGLRQRNADFEALGASGRRRLPIAAGRLARLIRSARPHILHSHEFDTTLLAVLLGRLLGCGVVRTRHYSDAIQRLRNPLKRLAYMRTERWMNAQVGRIVAPARRVRETLIVEENVESAKIAVIPYGQTRDRFEAISRQAVMRVRAALNVEDRPLLVYVARLHPEKGHRYLLEALVRLRSEGFDGVLCLVGTGPQEHALRALASRLDLSRTVRFVGWRDDALAFIAAADLVVHPSLHEALSSAIIEAIALQRPTLASDVSGVRDVLGDSQFGLVVPPGDIGAIVTGIQTCLGSLHEWHNRAAAGAERLFQEMSASRTAKEHAEMYLAEASIAAARKTRVSGP